MATLDKYILRGLIVNYVVAIAVMISLYVVLDLFFNMDEFTEAQAGAQNVILDILSFYGNRVFLYFAQLSGVITLFACLVTLARMRRLNELTAVLASGVSLHRVAAPVIAFAMFTTALWYVDTEFVIPSIAHKLARRHDDARGQRTFALNFLQDRDNALLSARQYNPNDQILKRMLVLQRDGAGELTGVIEAERASWEPPSSEQPEGRWRLDRGIAHLRERGGGDGIAPAGGIDRKLVASYVSDLDPKAIEMRQSTGWIKFLSASSLSELAKNLDGESLRYVLQAKHTRFTTPIINLVLLLLGLPFILNRSPGSIIVEAGKALLVCGACFLLTFIVQNVGAGESFSALPAWMPIIVFTPVAAVLIDRIRT